MRFENRPYAPRTREEAIRIKRNCGDALTKEYKCLSLDRIEPADIPYQQCAVIEPSEPVGVNCVQSFIDNMSFPTSLEELHRRYVGNDSLVENILSSTENEWTAPKWAKLGDVVFFMHSKTARSTITRLRTELIASADSYSAEDYQNMMTEINRGLETHAKYGGKIFAIGRVCGSPEYFAGEDDDAILHWYSRHYAKIDNIVPLVNPIDISEFNSFILVSRGSAITPVWGSAFDNLKEAISLKNNLPEYASNSTSRPLPLRLINRTNWLQIANDYRRCFLDEQQFRSFYVDYLLASIGDKKSFYFECRCSRADINDSFMDNVILFQGKYLAVEVKLSVLAEQNINAQVSKYCYNSKIVLDNSGKQISGEDMHPGKVLIIDTEHVYIYCAESDFVTPIFDLDSLTSFDDLPLLCNLIGTALA